MQRFPDRRNSAFSIIFLWALLAALTGCSEMGKRYVAVEVQSDPPGATVWALIDNKLGGAFSPNVLGTSPMSKKTMYYAFGAPGVGDTRLGVRILKAGYKDYDVLYTRDECFDTREEALANVKKIFVNLEPKENADREQDDIDNGASNPRKDEQTITADHFAFRVPVQWSRAGASDERQVRNLTTRALKGVADERNFFVFNSPQGYVVIVYDIVFRSEKQSLTEAQATNKQNFEMGVSRGIVKTMLSNSIVTVGKVEALENDWIAKTSKTNNRNLVYVMYTPDDKVSVNVSAFFPDSDEDFADQVKNILP